ncbi:hypothetical protein M758_UG129500 [Ceratodon purpureus]|nr:hypothetical protein M758_UG129500 [Ceratodon purpureus]
MITNEDNYLYCLVGVQNGFILLKYQHSVDKALATDEVGKQEAEARKHERKDKA